MDGYVFQDCLHAIFQLEHAWCVHSPSCHPGFETRKALQPQSCTLGSGKEAAFGCSQSPVIWHGIIRHSTYTDMLCACQPMRPMS